MKITVLIEDKKTRGFKHEHGLSLYFEHNNKRYLLDVGKSAKFLKNAKKLGIDIARVDAVFISHNHYDHIGGLAAFFKVNKNAKVYIKSAAKQTYYAKIVKDLKIKVIGDNSLFEKYPERFVFVDDALIVDGIYIISDTMGDKNYFCKDTRLIKEENGKTVPDDFTHEMFLAIPDGGKAHVLSSCSHRGIINILNTVKQTIEKPIGLVLGGFHLWKDGGKAMNCTPAFLEDIAEKMTEMNPDKIITGHCTGAYAYHKLKDMLGDKIESMTTGQTIDV